MIIVHGDGAARRHAQGRTMARNAASDDLGSTTVLYYSAERVDIVIYQGMSTERMLSNETDLARSFVQSCDRTQRCISYVGDSLPSRSRHYPSPTFPHPRGKGLLAWNRVYGVQKSRQLVEDTNLPIEWHRSAIG